MQKQTWKVRHRDRAPTISDSTATTAFYEVHQPLCENRARSWQQGNTIWVIPIIVRKLSSNQTSKHIYVIFFFMVRPS